MEVKQLKELNELTVQGEWSQYDFDKIKEKYGVTPVKAYMRVYPDILMRGDGYRECVWASTEPGGFRMYQRVGGRIQKVFPLKQEGKSFSLA